MNVTLRDFQPVNNWEIDLGGETFSPGYSIGQPKFIIDQTTDRKYLNEDMWVVNIKCCFLLLTTPYTHPIPSIVNIAYRILKLVTFSHFWMEKTEEKTYNIGERLTDAGIDLLRIIVTPISIVGLEIAVIYGMLRPYDGRKLYASIERATFGRSIIAPCFQPNPKYHAFGGDINEKNAF